MIGPRPFVGLPLGPQAQFAPQPADDIAAEAPQEQAAAPPVRPMAMPSSARDRAWRFIEFGDKQFRAGEYHAALVRYKKAAISAGDLADAHFRQALAYLALGQYDRGTEAVIRGLTHNSSWPTSAFHLDEVYTDDAQKALHHRELMRWLDEHPQDANAHFLLGVFRHFNGAAEQAVDAFRRTLELVGIGEHARAFLPPQE
jgi:tetratricopeptide (TPR) repeat protein